jgi:hypothetical protein
MRSVAEGDIIGGGGYGFGGGGAWWGFAFIVFIIFAIIIAFAWLGGKRDHGGLEQFLPLLGLMKGNWGDGDGCRHTEAIKDQAKDTGQIIHNQDKWAYDLKASQDYNTASLAKEINSFRDEFKDTKINDLRAELSTEKAMNAIGHSHGDLKREIMGIKEHFKPGWFEPAYACGK